MKVTIEEEKKVGQNTKIHKRRWRLVRMKRAIVMRRRRRGDTIIAGRVYNTNLPGCWELEQGISWQNIYILVRVRAVRKKGKVIPSTATVEGKP